MKWIKAFLGIEILLVSGHLLFMVKIFVIGDIRGFDSLNSLQFILGLGPMAILILTFFSPGILYGLPRVPEHRAEVQIPEKPAENGKTAGKTSHIKLESGYLQSIGNEADAFMEKFQPYTNPHFNLSELSVMLHIPDHHFTYYFREVKKQTFSDYRNQWRVEHAKKLIREGKSNDLTLEAIGILSGFSSRNTFLNAFKKAEGISPQAFLLQVKKK
jgi:AraC-like DNA-binding protein